jgi:Dockerin type I domain
MRFDMKIQVLVVAALAPFVIVNLGLNTDIALGESLSFRRVDLFLPGTTIPHNPSATLLVASAGANGEGDFDESSDIQELIAHGTTSSIASNLGALAEADNMGTAAVLTPIDATTFGPTVDATFFLRSYASGTTAAARSKIDEGSVEAPAAFQIESIGQETQGFLHGFLYLAENGGIVEAGEGANAQLLGPELHVAQINDLYLRGSVAVNEQGEKRALLNTNLPGIDIDGQVESINHLFHFVVPTAVGSGVTMIAQINDIDGLAASNPPGDLASVQWSVKATAWAYASTDMPSIEINTAVRVYGDYNSDGIVNAADYTVWRNALGSATDLDADGDGDGTVDQDDYQIWKLTFGSTVESGMSSGAIELATAVPEPPSMTLMLCAMVVVCFRGSYRNHDC